jgi:hypothetical protein
MVGPINWISTGLSRLRSAAIPQSGKTFLFGPSRSAFPPVSKGNPDVVAGLRADVLLGRNVPSPIYK